MTFRLLREIQAKPLFKIAELIESRGKTGIIAPGRCDEMENKIRSGGAVLFENALAKLTSFFGVTLGFLFVAF